MDEKTRKEIESSDYEDIAPSLKEFKIENDGIWLSWSDLWRIDAVACRNGIRAMKKVKNNDSVAELLFQNFIGQRMLIEEIAELIRPKTEEND